MYKYDDWSIDMPCYTPTGMRGHFAGLAVEDGKPMVWELGKTSFTARGNRVSYVELLSIEDYEASK